MARIYLASSWRNQDQQEYVSLLRSENHEVYDFRHPRPGNEGFQWTSIASTWKDWSAREYVEAITTHPVAAQGYLSDYRAMEWADTCVLLLPCGRSAHLEGGWMKGRGKRLIIKTQDGEEPELMALMADHIVCNQRELMNVLRRGA